MRSTARSHVIRALPGLAAAWLTALAGAQAAVHVELPAQPLADSLRAIGSQTHTNILFDPPLVAGRRGAALAADLPLPEILARLLAGQDIRYEFVNATTVVLSRPPAASTAGAAEGAARQAGGSPAPPPAVAAAATGALGPDRPRARPPVAPADDPEVVVTGSRIIRPGMSSPTPLTAITPEELAGGRPLSLGEGLAQLPQLSTSTTPQSIGGHTTLGPGTFLNLRGLGPTRDLVLLDGRRVAPSNLPGDVDVNLLPQALVRSVSIVTGGASAAYGSDAVAGVTNFILDTRFTGFKAQAGGGISAHEDGTAYTLALAWGTDLLSGRAHLTASLDWRHSQQAHAANRGWSDGHCAVIPIPGVTPATQSPSNPRQTLACDVTQPGSSYGGAITTGPLVSPSQGITFGPGGVEEPFTYGTLRTANDQVGGMGNYLGDVVNLITPLDTRVLFGHLSYDLGGGSEAYAQLTASRVHTDYAQTPPYFNGGTAFTIYSGNPFIPAGLQARMTALAVPGFQLGITPVSWGVIGATQNEQAYDAVAGLKGGLGTGLAWEVYYEHGRTQLQALYPGQISLANLYRAIDTVSGPDGAPACRSALLDPARYGGCVPLDPFGAGSASAAALDYIHGTGRAGSVMTQDDASAGISGTPLSLWAGPLSLGTGIEWRRLAGEQGSDLTSHSPIDFTDVRGVPAQWLSQVGGWATTNALPFSGAYHVTEGYIELLAPLARQLPGARSLELNAAARVTGYSQAQTVATWKAGLTWRPVDELLLRATRSRDIRAPGIADLYSPATLTPNLVVIDRASGGQSVSVPTALLGNPQLTPETANTSTFGLTWQPAWARALALSVDYYDIRIEDVLASVSAQDTIDRCARGESSYCAQLSRDPAGTLTLVRLPTLNLSQARTRGVDIDASERLETAGGTLALRLLATGLLEQSTTTPSSGGRVYSDRAGDITLGAPRWLMTGMTSYDLGPVGVDLGMRFVSCGLFNATYVPGDLDPRHTEVASHLTVSTGLRYRLGAVAGAPQLYFSVQNVFNRDPPLVPGNSLISFQTSSALYDTMGRYFTAGVRVTL